MLAATSVAWELYQIFMMQGFPLILQCDNGKEFVNNVIVRLKRLAPECTLVRGRPRHPQTQGSNERGNADCNNMVGKWMKVYNSDHWAIGIHKVGNEKNKRWHKSVKSRPYDLLYGQVQRTNLKDLPIDKGLLEALATESQLATILGCQDYAGVESEEDDAGSEESEDEEFIKAVPGFNSNVYVNALANALENGKILRRS